MNHGHHSPHHWIAVAFALAALMLTITEANGQTTGSSAVFEGRPAISGAQGGMGAQSGMPQGGLAVENRDTAGGLTLPRTAGTNEAGSPRNGTMAAAPSEGLLDKTTQKDIVRKQESGIARDQRSAVKKTKRAAKSVAKQARTGVSTIDSTTN